MKYLSLALLLLLIVGCKTYNEDQITDFDKQIEGYLKEKGIACERSESGLYYSISEQGEGRKIQYKDVVEFNYKGSLLDGSEFTDGKPLKIELSKLIGCWKEVMLLLNEGGKAYIVSPPQLGYGTHKLDGIPANSILVYELEVISVN